MLPEVWQLLSTDDIIAAGVSTGGGLGPAIGPSMCPDEGATALLTVSDMTTSLLVFDEGSTALFIVDEDTIGCPSPEVVAAPGPGPSGLGGGYSSTSYGTRSYGTGGG